jgi:hypothetical protein
MERRSGGEGEEETTTGLNAPRKEETRGAVATRRGRPGVPVRKRAATAAWRRMSTRRGEEEVAGLEWAHSP